MVIARLVHCPSVGGPPHPQRCQDPTEPPPASMRTVGISWAAGQLGRLLLPKRLCRGGDRDGALSPELDQFLCPGDPELGPKPQRLSGDSLPGRHRTGAGLGRAASDDRSHGAIPPRGSDVLSTSSPGSVCDRHPITTVL